MHNETGSRRLRLAADELSREPKATFRRQAHTTQSEEVDRMVARAAARAKEGDREAVRYLYLRYSDNVYGYVRSIVRDDHEAEDVTQHVFAKVMTVIGKYDPSVAPFRVWALRLAHNVAIDHLRKRRAIPTEEVFGSDERGDEASTERSQCLRDALDTLPEEQRTVVVLRHVVGLTPPEIAESMGRSESSVHGLHHRGRRALQEQLAEMESGPQTSRARLAA
jgi:RNA polymerase sigma-70 factor, ECF subfamily